MTPSYRWDVWLDYIGQREVIPILGSELSQVIEDDVVIPLDQWIAKRLASKYQIPWPPGNGGGRLNTLVWKILDETKEPESIVYADVRDVVREGGLTPPEWLRKLARVRDFDLFVTTTFDPLLEAALNEERYQGAAKTLVINNSLRKVGDLPEGRAFPMGTTLVHLMGQMSAPPYFAVTENDMLEFLCRLQNEATRPQRLFDVLRENHLLLLGGEFPDWVTRMVLRLSRNEPLPKRKLALMETLADSKVAQGAELRDFLAHFSNPTVIYPDGNGIAFIDELYARWTAANAPSGASESTMAPVQSQPGKKDARGIFISYAHEDRTAARTLKNGLEQNSLDVWLDERKLRGGDDFERKIGHQIDNCAAFVPLISRQTEARREGWFRREWARAIERRSGMHADVPFIFPVSIDDTSPGSARWVADEFMKLHWYRCPEGQPAHDLVDRLAELADEK